MARQETKYIVIHCSQTRPSQKDVDAKWIDRVHRERGWTKIGWTPRNYDYIRITNGYGNDTRPYIKMKYPGYTRKMRLLEGDTIPTQHYAIPINRELWIEYREELNGDIQYVGN